METTTVLCILSAILLLSGALCSAVRSALLVAGDDGVARAAARDAGMAALEAAVLDERSRHPFGLFVAAALLKVVSAFLAGVAAVLMARNFIHPGDAFDAALFSTAWFVALLVAEVVSTRPALRDPVAFLSRHSRVSRILVVVGAYPGRLACVLGRIVLGDAYRPETLMDPRSGSEEGILDVVQDGAEAGTIGDAEGKMIEGVLRAGETVVAEVMTPWAETVVLRTSMTFDDVASIVSEDGHSRYPVMSPSGDELVGIILVRSLFRNEARACWTGFVEKPFLVPESMPMTDLFRRFRRERKGVAVAIDEHGKLCGLATVTDLLERIVGSLPDEGPVDARPILEPDGSLSVPGETSVRILREEFGVDIPVSPHYETAAGFVVDALQEVPEQATTFTSAGWRVTVVELERYRIRRLRFERGGVTQGMQ